MTAMWIASLKPLRKIAPRMASITMVAPIWVLIALGTNGFWLKWAAASAADSVMVMMKSVVAKPSKIRTNVLPLHLGKSFSSIAILPWPLGLAAATRL